MSYISKDAPLTFWEGFIALWLIISFVAFLAFIPALGLAFKDNPNSVKRSVDATLIEAHAFSQSTGKYSSEIAWQGRFQLLDGRTIDQQIDGFFYKNFINGGEKPIKSWVSVSGKQLGKPDPAWVDWMTTSLVTGLLGMIMFLIGLLLSMGLPTRE